MEENNTSKFYINNKIGIFKISDIMAITNLNITEISVYFGIWLKNSIYLICSESYDKTNKEVYNNTIKNIELIRKDLIKEWIASCSQ